MCINGHLPYFTIFISLLSTIFISAIVMSSSGSEFSTSSESSSSCDESSDFPSQPTYVHDVSIRGKIEEFARKLDSLWLSEMECVCSFGGQTAKFFFFIYGNAILIVIKALKDAGALIVSTVAVPLIIVIVFLFTIVKIRRYGSYKKNKAQENIESIIKQHGSFAPKRYRYAELKKITNSFNDELGQGGFGRVFKGSLKNGCPVAVKILHNSSRNGDEFVNEVMSIGRTSHINIFALLGFCIDKSNHALIYEYMPSGSLDKYIYSENPKANLGWEKLHVIAVGVARGLEYLHRGCSTRIVHFDIKPQNILLDEDFCPKIADFGLAKLYPPKESIVSLAEMRGTIGYIAPEVFSRSFGVVSTKSNVYSYGMMVLEMVGGRRNSEPCIENSSQAYFPHWLHNRLVEGIEIELCRVTTETEKIAKKMALIGLWCTQTNPVNRHSMGRVLEMFERSLDELELPPKPLLASPPHDMMASISSSSLI